MWMKGATLSAKNNKHSMVKPAEFIDVVELTALKLHDKRLFNELLANAWEDIGEGKEHTIHKNDIKAIDKNLHRLEDSLERLMGTIIKTLVAIDGEDYTRRFHFLARVDNAIRSDGLVKYKFSDDAEELMLNSNMFARIQREIMFALSSKYSLSLYEVLAKRMNLKHKQHEIFELDAFRGMIGVAEKQYKLIGQLRERVLDTAFGEVGQLTNVGCAYELIRVRGKGYTHIKVTWFAKDPSASFEAQQKRSMTKDQQISERKEHSEMLRTVDKQARKHRNKG